MIAKIAWKNIWRNKLRSLVVITSIVMGIWAGAFMFAYVFGMMEQRLEDALGYEISHIQIHNPDFLSENETQYSIKQSTDILNTLREDDQIFALTGRVLAYGMVTAPTTTSSGKFIGIDPANEHAVTKLADRIVEGEYLTRDHKNKVVIGKKLADKLKVKLRSKIVLTFQDNERNIVAGAFRVNGIYKNYNSSIEESYIYLNSKDLSRLIKCDDQVHEIAMLLNEPETVLSNSERLSTMFNSEKVRSWKAVAPELALMIDSLDQTMTIFLIIIMLALSFGIVNTMLMAVLERVREIGVLMAVGMNKTRLFGMIFLETIFIVCLAAPFGLLIAYITISYLETNGLDLSGLYQEGYASFGFQTMIYPHLEVDYYLRILFLVIITALLSSIYPAITALRLDPVKAIKKI